MKKIVISLLLSVVSLFAFEHLTVENFDKKIKDKNVIVDFYATWCPPCKVLAKNLKAYDKVKSSDVIIYKVDIDKNMNLALKHNVKALPTLGYFKNGKLVIKEVGIKDVAQLSNSTKKYFK